MSPSSMKILCRYQYDPLDRLVGLGPLESLGTERFYQKSYLANEIEDQVQRTIIRNEAQPLAQRQSMADVTETTLLATDQQHSVLKTLTGTNPQQMTYTAYGHHPVESGLTSLLGFNGERPDSITGHYLLGQGKRAFNPVLMRFNSPDELSPFGEGGINPYAYCGNDPINRYDPTGNIPVAIVKPWNFPTRLTKKIFRPWEQLKALDLSSTTISRSRLATPKPGHSAPTLSDLLDAPSNRQQPSTSRLPPEGPTRPTQPRVVPRSRYRETQYTYLKSRAADARQYDDFMKRNPSTQVAADPELLEKFNSAQAHLAKLKAEGATLHERNIATAIVQRTRQNAKSDVMQKVKEMGLIIRTE